MQDSKDAPARRFHSTDSAYVLPNDNPEHQRLEIQAVALEKLMFQNIFHAPVNQPRRILEIGCGTGRTTLKLAAKFPNAKVIGVDLSPVPPIYEKPDNVEFLQGDIKDLVRSGDERLRTGSFDYIFHRLLILGMTDWPGFFKDVVTLLAPGGWVESHENEVHIRDANNDSVEVENESFRIVRELMTAKGIDILAGFHLRNLMKRDGLVDIQQDVFWLPVLPVPEKPETDLMQPLVAKMPFALAAMWDRLGRGVYSKEKIQELKKEMHTLHDEPPRKKGEHYNMYVVCGRKCA